MHIKQSILFGIVIIVLVLVVLGIYASFHSEPGVKIISVQKVSWGLIKARCFNKGLKKEIAIVDLRLWDKGVLVYEHPEHVTFYPLQIKTVVFPLPNILKGYDSFKVEVFKKTSK